MNDNERTHSRLYWKQQGKAAYLLTGICTMCGKEFNNGNLRAASYCADCAEKVKREKTAERVKRFRERQKAKKERGE